MGRVTSLLLKKNMIIGLFRHKDLVFSCKLHRSATKEKKWTERYIKMSLKISQIMT